MTASSPWPDWLTRANHRRIDSLRGIFTWYIASERGRSKPSVLGQWAPGGGPEINVALRETGMSLVGVYPHGEGFWPNRVPESVTTPTAYTGTFDEVLTKAEEWRQERMQGRAEQEPQG